MRGIVRGSSMRCVAFGAVGVLTCVAAAGAAVAEERVAALQQAAKSSAFMRVYGPSQPPYGFVRFCEARSEACVPQKLGERRIDATPERLSELDEINRGVNRAVQP